MEKSNCILLKPDVDKRRMHLEKICKSKKSWKFRIALHAVCMLAAVGMMITMAVFLCLFGEGNIEMIVGFLVCTGLIALVPFFIGISIKNTAKYKCGEPYSGIANGFLFLEDDSLRYVYWRCSAQSPAAYSSKRKLLYDEMKKFECEFLRENISSITIDDFHVCHIKGNGQLTIPITWSDKDCEVDYKKVKKLDFLIAFEQDDAEDIINRWKTSGVYNE